MKKELITHFAPKDPESEMFRNLRTNIQYMNTKIKTLLVTSTMPEEGKSYVSANLAVTFAQAGKKVVLIDSDMRKGRLYNIFDLLPRPGLSNYLSGVVPDDFDEDKDDIISYIQQTEIRHLYVITAGNVPPNPSELLISPKMTKMINDLKNLCDIIIFDSTPSLIVADPTIIARQVDSTIIVTAYNKTKMDRVEKVKEAIEKVGGNVAGVVLNQMPISNKKYEDTYYYGTKSENKKSTNKRKKSNPKLLEDIKSPFEDLLQDRETKRYTRKTPESNLTSTTTNVANSITGNEIPKALQNDNNTTKNSYQNSNYQNNSYQNSNYQNNNYQNNNYQNSNYKKEEPQEELDGKTKDLLNQINQYLESEKKKLNGDIK